MTTAVDTPTTEGGSPQAPSGGGTPGNGPPGAPADAAPASGGGGRSTATSRHSTKLGLAMRFSVTLDNTHLGEWQSCSGLALNFKADGPKYRGGDHLSQYYLAGQLEYPAITLTRAMNGKDSPKLQQWLAEVTRNWAQGLVDDSRTATITLLDADRRKVVSWTLRGVVPLSWTGPDLSASSNAVAIEKLQLGHHGFLTSSGQRPSSGQTRNVITLSRDDKPSESVRFPYNTETISMNRSIRKVKTAERDNIEENVTTYTVKSLILAGPETQRDVDRLLQFATKESGADGGARQADGGAPTTTLEILPDLTFSWGTFHRTVKLTALSTSYTRFNSDGIPIRATIELTLEQIDQRPGAALADVPEPPAAPGAPSSGQQPGSDAEADPARRAVDPDGDAGAGNEGGDAEDRRPSAGRDVRTGRAQRARR